jgi:glycosyltransferase involved in cell wall biosynthesis
VKIGYLSHDDPTDKNAWSGLTFAMIQALREAGAEVDPLLVSSPAVELVSKVQKAVVSPFLDGRMLRDREPAYLRLLSQRAEAISKRGNFDALLSPGSLAVSYARLDKPLFIWTDACFASMIDFYPQFTGLSRRTVAAGLRAEAECFSRCTKIVFSSSWAAEACQSHYAVSSDRIAVIPFGSNFGDAPAVISNAARLESLQVSPRFLLFGKEWNRKGGDRAIRMVRALRSRGLDATLTVVGVEPDKGTVSESWLTWRGFISKNDPAGVAAMEHELDTAHFLVLLSRADCTPLVIAEAASHGLPTIASAVGGIPEMIANGQSGLLVDDPDDDESTSDQVQIFIRDPAKYEQLSLGARSMYDNRLNWTVAGRSMLTTMGAGGST